MTNLRVYIYIFGAVFALTLNSCAIGQKSGGGFFGGALSGGGSFAKKSSLFEDPPEKALFSDKKIFKKALELHKDGQTQPAIQLWKDFLKQQPKSFEALNNLGMTYYSDDNLDDAIQSFKAALELRPFDEKIVGNLVRALRFRSTLAKENREYPRAVADLQAMATLVAPGKKEKILKEVEQQQDVVYKQVEQTNSLAAYESFVSEYPDSIFAEKARLRMAKLSPQATERNEFESGMALGSPPREQPTKPESVTKVVPPPLVEGNLSEEKETDEIKDFSVGHDATELTQKKVAENGSLEPMRKIKIVAGTVTDEIEGFSMGNEADKVAFVPPRTTLPKGSRKVKITTKHSKLNIRKSPSTKSPVIGKVSKGTLHNLLEEKNGWFHIVYSKGKTTGWISKKYSQVVK